MDDSFFVPLSGDGSRWRATVHSSGPWDECFQHGGPPSALLARAVERTAPRPDVVVARTTVEILGPIPVGELALSSRMLRPGRSVELVEAVLTAGHRDVARMSAWRVLSTTAGPTAAAASGPPPPVPDAAPARDTSAWSGGYLAAVEWRFTQGHFTEPGPGAVWARLRWPIVPDEEPSPLQRVLAIADSSSGISSELDPRQWHFINTDLTVHLHRQARGDWVHLAASTSISPGGAGLATSVLSDPEGPLGVSAQALLVAPRP